MHAAVAIKPEEKKRGQSKTQSTSVPQLDAEEEFGASVGLPIFMQAKLAISKPNDPYEQEADRVAERVMRTPEPTVQRRCECGLGASAMTDECEECGKKRLGLQTKPAISELGDAYEQEAVCVAEQVMWMSPSDVSMRKSGSMAQPMVQQRAFGGVSRLVEAPPIVHEVLSSSGRPLEQSLRQDMEKRFNYDFTGVRVHTDAIAAESARTVNAHAYTAGHDLVFNQDRYSPDTREGRKLIAHELTHVVQQNGLVWLQRNKIPDDVIHENAMQLVEDSLRKFYEALPREVRINLKANGALAIAMVSQKGTGKNPRLVYAVAGIANGPAIQKAGDNLNLNYVGDTETGVSTKKPHGPARQYGPNDGPPPGTGGLEHAEQLIKSHAEQNGRDIDGLVVSRALCHDCVFVMQSEKGGRIKISVIEDPDKTLPNPRDEAIKKKEAAKVKEAEKAADPPEVPDSSKTEGSGRKRSTRGRSRDRKPPTESRMGGRRATIEKTGSLREGKVTEVVNRHGGGGGTQGPPETKPTGPIEGRGKAVEPITLPEPAIAQQEIKGGVEGAAVMINAGLFRALQDNEVQKAVDYLKELSPEINKWREQGYGVKVTMVVEVPDQPDVIGHVVGVHDVGQVVLFKRMYISSIMKPVGEIPEGQSVISANYAPGDPDHTDPHEETLSQQIDRRFGENPSKAHKGYHLKSGELDFPAPTRFKKKEQPRKKQQNLLSLAGSYKSEYMELFKGDPVILGILAARTLRVDVTNDGKLTAQMRLGSQEFNYPAQKASGEQLLFGRFRFGGKDGTPFSSNITYYPDKNPNLLLEWFEALDPEAGPGEYWKKILDGLISWRKI